MSKRSKTFFLLLVTILIVSVFASYYRYYVNRDYLIEIQIDCDPSLESCFVWNCDSTIEGECTGDQSNDIWYYKYFYRNAKNVPICNPSEENCDVYTCQNNEENCYEKTCTDDSILFYDLSNQCTNIKDLTEISPHSGEAERD